NIRSSLPPNVQVVSITRSRRRNSRGGIVFPDLDSPPMPSFSPSAPRTLTPSTALTHPRTPPSPKPPPTGKYFFSPTASSIITASGVGGGGHPAVRQVTALERHAGRIRLGADRLP